MSKARKRKTGMTGNRSYNGEEKTRMMVKGGPAVRAWMGTGQETLEEMSPRS